MALKWASVGPIQLAGSKGRCLGMAAWLSHEFREESKGLSELDPLIERQWRCSQST